MKLYALHTIHRTGPNGPEVVAAKSVFTSTADEFEDLARLGAARAATKEEIALAKEAYKAKNGGSAEGFDDATTEKVQKVEKTEAPKGKGGRASKADKGEKSEKPEDEKPEGEAGEADI